MLVDNYLGIAAVAAVAAYENESRARNNAVADTEVGELYLRSEINIAVAEQTDVLAAGRRIFKIDILTRQLIQRERRR